MFSHQNHKIARLKCKNNQQSEEEKLAKILILTFSPQLALCQAALVVPCMLKDGIVLPI